jgi:DNA-binding NarL/FixJ family response regulator
MTDLNVDPTARLLERGTELEALIDAVATTAGGDGLVVTIEGPAGIGKSALLEAARESARRSGLRTLTASGSELERDFGFGVVRRLFEAVSDTAGPVPIALAPADADAAAADPVEATYAALNGLYRLTERLSEDQPLALLVDDLQWADAASLRYLAYLVARLESVPVLVVGAVRTPVPPGTPHPAAVLSARSPRVIEPAPLSPAGTGRLVRSIAGDVDETTARACYDATGGSPFYTRELAGALQLAGHPADAIEATPARIVRAVSARISGLCAPARALAVAAATLGAGASLRLAAGLAGLDPESAGAAADALRGAGILGEDSALQFTHPIVLAAVRESIPLGARSSSHAKAARLLHTEQARAERVATHVAATEPMGDPWAVEQLARAGAEALASGAPEAAMTSLRRALLEPPPPEALPGLLGMLGFAEALSGQPEPAAEHLRTALELAADPTERMQAGFALAGVLTQGGRGGEALTVLEALLDEVGAGTPAALRIAAELANHSRFGVASRKRAGAAAARLVATVEARGSDDPAVLASAAAELAMAGRDAPRVRELSLRALAAIETPRIGTGDFSAGIAIRALCVADGLAEADRALTAVIDGAAERGVGPEWGQASVFRADAHLRRGAILDAEADARAAFRIAQETPWPMGVPATAGVLVDVLVERGELGEATEVVERAGLGQAAAELPDFYTSNLLLLARGRLRVALGEPDAGLEDLLECGRREDAMGETNPALSEWRSRAALALAHRGETGRARALALEEVAHARAFGAQRAIGVALQRAAAVLDDERRLPAAREAVAVLEDSPARLAHAYALAQLGDALLGDGEEDEARDALRSALDTAHACGSIALEQTVLEHLRLTGVRPRRPALTGPEALTPSERRAAELAAAGLSNREIAAALFVSQRTVEYHLFNGYRKLGINSRGELAAALGAG